MKDKHLKWYVLIVLIVLFVISQSVNAHHKPQHAEIYLNELTKLAAVITVCKNREAAEALMKAYEEDGVEGANNGYNLLHAFGICTQGAVRIKVLEVIKTVGEHKVSLVRFVAGDGKEESPEYWGLLAGLDIKKEKPQCFDCVPI